jgi:hypothetical protein
MTGFDGNEYQLITQIRVDASRFVKQCGSSSATANATQIAYETEMFEKYSEQLPRNEDGYKASVELNQIAQGLQERYDVGAPVSSTFCRVKYVSIENSAKILQHVLGNRPR